jgi:rod shape-determining protein MreC
MAVVHPRGVVGQITSVGSNSARVLLVNDHSSGVDVLIQGSRVRGVLEGAGEKVCELKFVTKENPVKVGDVVVTSGMDQVFPKGLVVGTVSHVSAQTGTLFQTVEVRPAVNFARVEEVVVVPAPQGVSAVALGEN